MKRFLSAFLIILTLLSSCSINRKAETRRGFYMDTLCEITLYGNDTEYFDGAFDILEKYDSLFDADNPESEIYKLNNSEENSVTLSPDTAELISLALSYRDMSGGLYNPLIYRLSRLWNYKSETVPLDSDIDAELKTLRESDIYIKDNVAYKSGNPAFDPGSSAKGYISDKICEYLISNGVGSAIINLGGNISFIGSKSGKDFTALLKSPFESNNKTVLSFQNTNISTCGTYERYFEKDSKLYHHIIDTQSGYPVENGLVSVTVIGENGAHCDIFSTVVFLLGPVNGLSFIEKTDNYEAIFIDASENITLSSGLKNESGVISFK